MIDIGANLANKSFNKDLEDVLVRAQDKSITNIIITGSCFNSNQQAFELAKNKPTLLYATAGLHPHHANEWNEAIQQQIQNLIDYPEVVAIGETGLDYNRNFSTPEQQRLAFSKHLAIAESCEKPLFLHQRDAHHDFFAMLSEHPQLAKKSVVHCFTDTATALDDYLSLGCSIGITGWLCDKKRGAELRETVKAIPLDRVMIESDAPYLMPHRDKVKKTMVEKHRNEPCTLGYVAQQLADCLQIDEQTLIEHTHKNTQRFFNLS